MPLERIGFSSATVVETAFVLEITFFINMDDKDEKIWEAVKKTVTPLEAAGRSRRSRLRAPREKRTLDLHGLTVNEAFLATRSFIENASDGRIHIITGKSGQINQEFLRWLEPIARIKNVTEKNGGGSYEIRLGSPRNHSPKSQ